MTTTNNEAPPASGDDLDSLQAAFLRGFERQAAEREQAREALIELLEKPVDDPDRSWPIDSVARDTGIHAEEVHLALGSLLADGTVQFSAGYELELRQEAPVEGD